MILNDLLVTCPQFTEMKLLFNNSEDKIVCSARAAKRWLEISVITATVIEVKAAKDAVLEVRLAGGWAK